MPLNFDPINTCVAFIALAMSSVALGFMWREWRRDTSYSCTFSDFRSFFTTGAGEGWANVFIFRIENKGLPLISPQAAIYFSVKDKSVQFTPTMTIQFSHLDEYHHKITKGSEASSLGRGMMYLFGWRTQNSEQVKELLRAYKENTLHEVSIRIYSQNRQVIELSLRKGMWGFRVRAWLIWLRNKVMRSTIFPTEAPIDLLKKHLWMVSDSDGKKTIVVNGWSVPDNTTKTDHII
jgi:hypothetical protein